MKQSPRHDDRRRFRERCRPQRRMFHVKHSVPVPTGARTRTRAITPNTHTRRSTADTKRGATSRQHPAQSVTNAHTWAPLAHAPAPRRCPRARHGRPTQTDIPGPQAREAPKSTALARPQNPQSPSPPPLAQAPREDPMPRRKDPGEHEARGEHQDDRGARRHVQRPRQVQAHQAP